MKVFISSTWKNVNSVRKMAERLRNEGHIVYDFTDRKCRKTPEHMSTEDKNVFNPEKDNYCQHMESQVELYACVMNNQEALRWCDLCILLQPCGVAANVDWAYALGAGKSTIVCGKPRADFVCGAHLWADKIIDNPEDVYDYIKKNY